MVRAALEKFVDERPRAEIGRQIVEGYTRIPKTAEELAWADDNARQMIDDEPW